MVQMLITLGVTKHVSVEVVNALLKTFDDSPCDQALVLGSPSKEQNVSSVQPIKAPIKPDAIKSFDVNIEATYTIWQTVEDMPEPVAKSCCVILNELSTPETQRCVLVYEFRTPEEKDNDTFNYYIAMRFDAAPLAIDAASKGRISAWSMLNAAALSGGVLTVETLQQALDTDGRQRSREAWKHITNLKPQATREWDSKERYDLRHVAAFCVDNIPLEILNKFVQRSYASECHLEGSGPYIRFIDSTSMEKLQENLPETAAQVTPLLKNPFIEAPLDVIDEFVKKNFPGSKLGYNRYIILDKYSTIGDSDSGNSCIVVVNEENEVGSMEPGPKTLRMKLGEAFEFVNFLGLVSLSYLEVVESAHCAMGVSPGKDESEWPAYQNIAGGRYFVR